MIFDHGLSGGGGSEYNVTVIEDDCLSKETRVVNLSLDDKTFVMAVMFVQSDGKWFQSGSSASRLGVGNIRDPNITFTWSLYTDGSGIEVWCSRDADFRCYIVTKNG